MGEAAVIWGRLTESFWLNCQLFGLTLLFAIPLGLVVAFGSMSRFAPLRGVVKTFVWAIRGTPLMLQILVIYLGPGLMGFTNPWPSGSSGRLVAAVVAFAINYACYFSEIYRGGIEAVPKGQTEAERGMVFDAFASKEHEILTATVLRILPDTGDMIVRIGGGSDKTDAMLAASEQVHGERYKEGDIVRVYVVEVRRSTRGPQIIVSRTHPGLVKRLFELEVPEIASGAVEVKSIAREAGSRTKIAVHATEENVDPVGACVGPRGGRVGAVVDELHGEKMDIVVWSEDPEKFIASALSPADVVSVTVLPGLTKACRVIVPDDQLSLAIGKEGQNARLAARLTGFKIDIKPASQAKEFEQAEPEQPAGEAPEAPAGEEAAEE